MKTLIIVLLFFGFSTLCYSQEKTESVVAPESMKLEELPEVVIKSAGKDFSVYMPDKNPDQYVRKLQQKFIAYNIGNEYEGFARYLVVMEGEKGSLSATYNETGKLIGVVENYKNVKLPSDVIYSIYKKFPGWEFVNDKFLYTQQDGDVIKKQYHIKIKKDNEERKLIVSPDGEILTGSKVANR